MRKYLTEALGTFLLTLVVALSLAGQFPVPTPVLAALTLGLFVYTAGHISGAHINPAVTIGVWSLKKISAKDAVSYLVAQFIGAAVALYVSGAMATPATLVAANTLAVGWAEFLGTVFFTFGIAAVVHGRVSDEHAGLVIGGSLLLGLSLASGGGSNAILNPAVALGISSFSWVYIVAPILGSLIGMNLYKWLTSQS